MLTRLAAAPWEYGFYQAMRRLEALLRDRPRFGRSVRPAQDPVRLGQEPSVTFAPAALARWEPGGTDHAARLLVHFFGLFGPDGPLPLHLTEYARDRSTQPPGPELAALRRHFPSPRAVAVLSRLGELAPDRQFRPAGGRSVRPVHSAR